MAIKSITNGKFQEKKKITIVENDFMEDAVKLVTEPFFKTGFRLYRKTGESEAFEMTTQNKGIINFLKKDSNYRIEKFDIPSKRGIKNLAGVPVNVKPKGRSYDDLNGVVVEFKAIGDTEEEMMHDEIEKHQILVKHFTAHNVPVGKICEEVLQCKYDYRT